MDEFFGDQIFRVAGISRQSLVDGREGLGMLFRPHRDERLDEGLPARLHRFVRDAYDRLRTAEPQSDPIGVVVRLIPEAMARMQ